MKKELSALVAGFVFALGLGISGMTQPQKVIAFLDVSGAWDPSLALVMVGAIGVHAIFLRLVAKRERSVLGAEFSRPVQADVTVPLVVGSAIFGVGWGLAGFCPGPVLVSMASPMWEAWLVVGGMLAGMIVSARLTKGRAV